MTTRLPFPEFTKEQEDEHKKFVNGFLDAIEPAWRDLKEAGAPCTMENYMEYQHRRANAFIEQWNSEHQNADALVETTEDVALVETTEVVAPVETTEDAAPVETIEDVAPVEDDEVESPDKELTAESLEAMVEEDMICEMLGVPYPTSYDNDDPSTSSGQAPAAVPNPTNERKRKARKPRRDDAVQLDMFDVPQQSGWKSALCLLGAAINVTATVLTTIACVTVGLLLGARP